MIEQKIIFVTGKGGVGKSTVALALAQNMAESKRVLLVELGLRSFYGDFLNTTVTYQPRPLSKNLDIALWSGAECLKEYAIHLLKVEALYNLFFENRISRALIEVAPALSELAILGKITSGIRQIGPPLDYDAIVVDCYATGHMLALLRAPRGMAEAVKFGPMADQTATMLACIRDPKVCQYTVVSLPEELPAVEADELFREIKTEVGITPTLICNKVWDTEDEVKIKRTQVKNLSAAETTFINDLRDFSQRQLGWINFLRHRHPDLKILPMIFSSDSGMIISSLREALK